jgi:hypothetical protein
MANKMDLVEKVSMTIGCTKADGERAVEAVIDMITEMLQKGDQGYEGAEIPRFQDFEGRSQISFFSLLSTDPHRCGFLLCIFNRVRDGRIGQE